MPTNKPPRGMAQEPSAASVHYLPRPHWTAEDDAARKKRKGKRFTPRSTFRAAELNRFFDFQYGTGAQIPGIVGDVEMMIHVLAIMKNPAGRIDHWINRRAPWFDNDDMIEAIIAKPTWFKADALAKRLGLIFEVRERLKIKTIGACDKSKRERENIRTAKKIANRRAKRRIAGKQARGEFERFALTNQRPWVTLGISRATWFRKFWIAPEMRAETTVRTIETGVTPMTLYTIGARPVSNQEQAGPRSSQIENITVESSC